jgi:hypothetical protein
LKDPPGAIERKVVTMGSFGSERVELYPPLIRFRRIINPSHLDKHLDLPEHAITVQFSVGQTLAELRARARAVFNLPEDAPIRLFRLPLDSDIMEPNAQLGALRSSRVYAHRIDPTKHEQAAVESDNTLLSQSALDEPVIELGVDAPDEEGNWAVRLPLGAPEPATADTTAPAALRFDSDKAFFNQGTFSSSSTASRPTAALKLPVNELQVRKTTGSASGRRSPSPFGGFGRNGTSSTRSFVRTKGLTGLNNLGNTCVGLQFCFLSRIRSLN